MEASPFVRGLDLVWLPVRDLDRAIAFYRDRLGLPLQYRSKVWAEFFSVPPHFALWRKPECDPCPGRVFLAVDDLGAAAERLRVAGVDVVFGPQTYFYGEVLEFADSEGNIVGLYRRTARE